MVIGGAVGDTAKQLLALLRNRGGADFLGGGFGRYQIVPA
jgi:hypothetical protein